MDKSAQLAQIYGASDPIALAQMYFQDICAPAICTNPDCDETIEAEHDCIAGECPRCRTDTMASIFVLLGMI